MMRRAWLPFLLLLILPFWPIHQKEVFAAPPTVPTETYRAQLRRAIAQLERIEKRAPRNLAPILTPLAKDRQIKRSDGQTQTASGDEFARWLKDAPGNATRDTTRRLRESLLARERALENWSRSTHEPADAQAIINDLAASGEIRVGPTWLEQSWSNFHKWVTETLKKMVDWVGSWFPTPTPGQMPTVDPNVIRAIFTLTVVALLVAIFYLIWRAVGGKIGRRKSKQGAFAFSPEDAELLLLPPDELRERARKFAEEGNFREALRHLYIALLLRLDSRGVWRYDARRTNWEHIAALGSDEERSTLVGPLSDLTRRFDRVRYGNADCGAHDWQRFEQDVNALEASTPAS